MAGTKAAFALAVVGTSIAPVWPPSGIALAAVLLLGYRAAPGVWLGAFLFNASTPVPLWVATAIGAGNPDLTLRRGSRNAEQLLGVQLEPGAALRTLHRRVRITE